MEKYQCIDSNSIKFDLQQIMNLAWSWSCFAGWSWDRVWWLTVNQEEPEITAQLGKQLQVRACCCCCCWVASVVPDSVQPRRRQPTGLPHPWDSPGKNTGVGCHFLLQCMRVKSESEIAQSCPTAAYQSPPPMGFSRQDYWSGLPLPSLSKLLGESNS